MRAPIQKTVYLRRPLFALLAALGCQVDTGSEADPGGTSSTSRCSREGVLAVEQLLLEPTSRVVSDFDCSGTLDSALVVRHEFRNYLLIDRAGMWDSLPMPEETSVRIVGVADANADGRLDLLLVDRSESQFEPHLFLLDDAGFRPVPFAMPYDLGSPAVLIDIENSHDCVARALPRFERRGEGGVTISLVLDTRVSLQCNDMPRMSFVVDSNRVRPLEAPR